MASLLLLQDLSSLCMWPELWQTTRPVRAAQEPYSAVWEGEPPVLPAKLSSCLGWEPPSSLRPLTRAWKANKQPVAGCQRSAGLRHASLPASPVFVLLGTEESLTTPINLLTLLYSAVNPCSPGKARAADRIGRACSASGLRTPPQASPFPPRRHGAPSRG